MSNSNIIERMSDLDVQIGARVRKYRLQAKMSQKDLGSKIGCSFQQVQKYETGSNHISAPRLILTAEALGVPPGLLISGVEGVSEDLARLNNPVVQLAIGLPVEKQHFAVKMLRHLLDL
jgi:transcriptional regulator with XRE-family HTH domain